MKRTKGFFKLFRSIHFKNSYFVHRAPVVSVTVYWGIVCAAIGSTND